MKRTGRDGRGQMCFDVKHDVRRDGSDRIAREAENKWICELG